MAGRFKGSQLWRCWNDIFYRPNTCKYITVESSSNKYFYLYIKTSAVINNILYFDAIPAMYLPTQIFLYFCSSNTADSTTMKQQIYLWVDLHRQEQTEVGMWSETVQFLLQLYKPLWSQMNVLQHHPATRLCCRIDSLVSLAEAFS